MQVQAINNNYNKSSFGARYTVKGNKHEVNEVFEIAKKYTDIVCNGNIMLHHNSDIILICTDKTSKKGISNLKKTIDPWTQYPEFLHLPLNIQLNKIFGKIGAKDVKEYKASEILNNPNFDFIEGIIK